MDSCWWAASASRVDRGKIPGRLEHPGVELRSSIARKVGIGVTITVLVLVIIGVVCFFTVHSLVMDVQAEARGEKLLRNLKELELNLTRAESATLRFALVGDADAERTFRGIEPLLKDNFGDLNYLLGDEAAELQLPALKRHTESRMKRLELVMETAKTRGSGAAFKLLNDGETRYMREEFESSISTMRAQQEALLRELNAQAEHRRQQAAISIALEALLALLMIYTMGRAVVRDLTGPLRRLVAGIEQIGEGRLDYRVEITSSDEVGQLGRAFNRMAEQLEMGRGLRLSAEEALQETNGVLADRLEELRLRNLEIEQMSRLTELLQTALRAEEAYEVVASFGERLFPDSSGTLFLTNAARTFLEAATSWGETHCERVFATEDCWAVRRGRAHPAVQPGALHCHHFHTTGNTLCIPLVAQGDALGVLCLEGEVLSEQLAVAVGEQLSLALANLRLRETLRNQSIRDPLTGLFNRRFLEESLDREMHRARRNNQTLGVMMVDLDHFKRFNDDFGHEAGDAVLQAVGHLLKTNVRAEDVPCRYGGEEFAVLLPGATLEVAAARAETLRAAAVELKVVSGGRSLGAITFSVGVAAFPQHGQDGAEVVRQADEALYRAKRAGRNQVQLAGEAEEPRARLVEGHLGGASLS